MVLVTTDERMRAMNLRHRGIDAATDVLSFPAPPTPGRRRMLGDIAIARPTADRQAELRGASVGDEIAMLAIHGALHLLGYEDESEEGRDRMIDLMNEAAAAAGLATDPEWRSRHHEEGN